VKNNTKKYLYIFGYQTPQQVALAATDQHSEESSEALFIEAESPEQALAWGREISDNFVRRLFHDQPIDWKSMNYVHWVECEQMEFPATILDQLQVVAFGHFPNFQCWIEAVAK
jgi:hypothetical protein